MAAQTIQTGTSSIREQSLTIYLYSDEDTSSPLGSVTYQQSDTVLEIKRRIEADLRYPTASQRFVLSGGTAGTPVQELGDARRLSDTDGTPSIRVTLANITNQEAEGTSNRGENTPPLFNLKNIIGRLNADQTTRTTVGQYHSETALNRGSASIPGGSNGIQYAAVRGGARVRVGDKFGGVDPDA